MCHQCSRCSSEKLVHLQRTRGKSKSVLWPCLKRPCQCATQTAVYNISCFFPSSHLLFTKIWDTGRTGMINPILQMGKQRLRNITLSKLVGGGRYLDPQLLTPELVFSLKYYSVFIHIMKTVPTFQRESPRNGSPSTLKDIVSRSLTI